ncbi:MAG: hypothetical protein M5U34_39630 [Chloroflexi bacterium]|nr:hypothetical protein [Chloroflexota bacterium]
MGERTLFEDVNLLINEGDRIGLIGPNGSEQNHLAAPHRRGRTGEPMAAAPSGAMCASASYLKTRPSTLISPCWKPSSRATRQECGCCG